MISISLYFSRCAPPFQACTSLFVSIICFIFLDSVFTYRSQWVPRHVITKAFFTGSTLYLPFRTSAMHYLPFQNLTKNVKKNVMKNNTFNTVYRKLNMRSPPVQIASPTGIATSPDINPTGNTAIMILLLLLVLFI